MHAELNVHRIDYFRDINYVSHFSFDSNLNRFFSYTRRVNQIFIFFLKDSKSKTDVLNLNFRIFF